MLTELKNCPACGRIYTDEDYCINCHYDDPEDSVELESIGEFTVSQIKAITPPIERG